MSPRACTAIGVGGPCGDPATWVVLTDTGRAFDHCEECAQDAAPVHGYNGCVAIPSPFLAAAVPR